MGHFLLGIPLPSLLGWLQAQVLQDRTCALLKTAILIKNEKISRLVAILFTFFHCFLFPFSPLLFWNIEFVCEIYLQIDLFRCLHFFWWHIKCSIKCSILYSFQFLRFLLLFNCNLRSSIRGKISHFNFVLTSKNYCLQCQNCYQGLFLCNGGKITIRISIIWHSYSSH